MPAKTLMVQGTASSVGKSTLVTALCRILKQDGWRVAPFKAQNMSLNSFVTPDGKEIGRAQAVQAEAAGVAPEVAMNPILLKPEAENRSQVVLMGKPLGNLAATDYYALEKQLWPAVTASLDSLCARFDVIVIEGAGSPVEVNLRDRDMVNMRVALYCRAPVLLLADIDRGGVFASLVGTLELLEPAERALIGGLVINKFRGDLDLLAPGLKWLEERTGLPVAGVLPYIHDLGIAEEDSISLERRRALRTKNVFLLDIAVIGLPHIANFDDFDPLEEDDVRLRYVESGDEIGDPDLLILPGTKCTIADLTWLKNQGWDHQIISLADRGTPIIGICGGYQMLGKEILDPGRVESREPKTAGLGLLPVTTRFFPTKTTQQIEGKVVCSTGLLQSARGFAFNGYEIHMGRTGGMDIIHPFQISARSGKPCLEPEGCLSLSGGVLGTTIHGLFHNEGVRRSLLSDLAARKGATFRPRNKTASREEQYNRLAELLRNSLDMEIIYRSAHLE